MVQQLKKRENRMCQMKEVVFKKWLQLALWEQKMSNIFCWLLIPWHHI